MMLFETEELEDVEELGDVVGLVFWSGGLTVTVGGGTVTVLGAGGAGWLGGTVTVL